ncbi:cupin domain-containing protein, partial [Salmonella enterica subsp. enterica serovar Oslo]|uniref:winged helix domain-containing protein n=1 Tax=Salmonella enterica TaxID=28901 RepID=UPI00288CD295
MPSRKHAADSLPQEMDTLANTLLALLNHPAPFQQWLGPGISPSRHELDSAPPEPPDQPDETYDALKQRAVVVRLAGLRVLRLGDEG